MTRVARILFRVPNLLGKKTLTITVRCAGPPCASDPCAGRSSQFLVTITCCGCLSPMLVRTACCHYTLWIQDLPRCSLTFLLYSWRMTRIGWPGEGHDAVEARQATSHGNSRASSVHVQPGHVDTGHVHELENLYREVGEVGDLSASQSPAP